MTVSPTARLDPMADNIGLKLAVGETVILLTPPLHPCCDTYYRKEGAAE